MSFFRKNSPDNVGGPVTKRLSQTNDTTARKFSRIVSQNQNPESVKNSDHVNSLVGSIQKIVNSVENIAENSRIVLDSIKKSIDGNGALLDGENIKAVGSVTDDGRLSSFVFSKKGSIEPIDNINSYTPRVRDIKLGVDKKKGSVDCFFSTTTFFLDASAVKSRKIVGVRIFRAVSPSLRQTSVLSPRAVDRISSIGMRTKTIGDLSTHVERVLGESAVPHASSVLNPIDTETNSRMATNISETFMESRSAPSSVITSRENSFLKTADDIDVRVADDIPTIKNLLKRIPELSHETSVTATSVSDSARAPVSEFREIAYFSVDKLRSKDLGDVFECVIEDVTVTFGNKYRYYLTTVDRSMNDSTRSMIVELDVNGIRVPARPNNVICHVVDSFPTLMVTVDDMFVEKFEVYRKELDAPVFNTTRVIRNVSDAAGFNTSFGTSRPLSSGYTKIGECVCDVGAGSTYVDRETLQGKKYAYRVFSVDVFGNKSESPFEVLTFVPEKSSRPNELKKPTLTAQVDTNTNKVALLMDCDDKRVISLFVERRDLTLNQKSFAPPGQVNFTCFGLEREGQGSLNYEDVLLRGGNKDDAWTGMFKNERNISFVDRSVTFDHTYQYRVFGVDRFGNRTPFDFSKIVTVTRKPQIQAPVSVIARVVSGPQFSVGGIEIQWREANIEINAEEKISDLGRIRGVKTLYQVERKVVGEERWEQFPLVEGHRFFDPSPTTAGDESPAFRPEFVRENVTYSYRIKAMQTGSFISNYCEPIEVFSALVTLPPIEFRLKTPSSKTNPFYVTLNWKTPENSGDVDLWEIERAEINNFAASRINLKSGDFVGQIKFEPFRKVYKEASRFTSQLLDATDSRLPAAIFTGDHYYQDQEVRFGNTYFYRIRAVGVDGSKSDWINHGIKLTDEEFENKLNATINPNLRKKLSGELVPIVTDKENSGFSRTFDLIPDFSKTKTIENATIERAQTILDVSSSGPLLRKR